jgi:hypothetical protein
MAKEFDPEDLSSPRATAEAPKFTMKNGDWACGACHGLLGAAGEDNDARSRSN